MKKAIIMSRNPFSASDLAKVIANQNLKSKSTRKSRQKTREAKIPWDDTRYYTIDGINVTEYIISGKTSYYTTEDEAKEHKAKFGGYYVKIYRKSKNNEFKHIGYGCPK